MDAPCLYRWMGHRRHSFVNFPSAWTEGGARTVPPGGDIRTTGSVAFTHPGGLRWIED